MAHDRNVPQAVQPLLRLLERLRRDVNEVHARVAAPALERLGEEDNLFAAAAPELDDGAFGVAQRRDDGVGVAGEQFGLRAGDVVPRQPANRLEQARAERVVQVLGLQLLGHEREIALDISGEFDDERTGGCRHDSGSSQLFGFQLSVSWMGALRLFLAQS